MVLAKSVNFLFTFKWSEHARTKRYMVQLKFRSGTFIQQCVVEFNESGTALRMNYRLLKQDSKGLFQPFFEANEIPGLKVNWDKDFISPNNLTPIILN